MSKLSCSKFILILCFYLFSATCLLAQPMPKFVAKDGRYTFLVDGKPFIALGAQVHNSSGWAATMEEAWPQLEALHVNTVEVPVYWQAVEPQPGRFNFEDLDRIIEGAHSRKLRLILLWFATWKNGMMNYTPEWIKTNPEKYPRVIGPNGKGILVLSPHSKANLDADRRAFRALMSHLKQFDGTKQTVIMVQVENESGSLGSLRDYSEEANQLFASAVPEALVKALKREPGTWKQVFGPDADEFFAAYSVATYINEVAKTGKAVYNLPMYVNAWLRSERTLERPGDTYPSGGPTFNVLDIWKAVTPDINLIAPDIYHSDFIAFQRDCNYYRRPDNPLFIPETGGGTANARYLFYALADGALGFSPFGVDELDGSRKLRPELAAMAMNYQLITPAIPALAELQSAGKLHSAVAEHLRNSDLIRLESYDAQVDFQIQRRGAAPAQTNTPANANELAGRALIGEFAPDELLVLGFDSRVRFLSHDPEKKAAIYVRVEEGQFDSGAWKMKRLWNGDEIDFGLRLPPQGAVLKVKLMPGYMRHGEFIDGAL
ncbi:MAG: DUF5597 domain-containing protein [Thermoguttaceae bacterium]